MLLKITTPKDEAHWLQMRTRNLNSTEISALFNANPYVTPFELWHQKKSGEVASDFVDNERTEWGKLLEPAIAERAAKSKGWNHRPMKDYYELTDLRIGSSFDFCIVDESEKATAIMEIKNVDGLVFLKTWIEDEDDNRTEPPPHIEIQAQVQMLVSGLKTVYLCVLVGGNKLKIIPIHADEGMQSAIINACAEFWRSIEANEPPAIDYKRDINLLTELYSSADNDKEIQADEEVVELAKQYLEAAKAHKLADEKKKEIKVKILEKIGDAAKVKHAEFSISAGVIDPVEVQAHVKNGYRNFKVTAKVKKASA